MRASNAGRTAHRHAAIMPSSSSFAPSCRFPANKGRERTAAVYGDVTGGAHERHNPGAKCDGAEILDGLLRQTERLQLAAEVRDPDRLVYHLAAMGLAHCLRDAMLIHFDRTAQPVGAAGMGNGVCQDRHNHADLVLGGDRHVTPMAEREVDLPLVNYVLTHARLG
jgi:hypothetical protein